MSYRRSIRSLTLATGIVVVAGSVAVAQIVEVPTFQAATPIYGDFLQAADVATAADGSVVVIWEESGGKRRAVTARFAADGTQIGTPTRVDAGLGGGSPLITPDTRGGFVAIYLSDDFPYTLRGRLLDAAGAPVGPEFHALCEQNDSVSPSQSFSVVGIPSGFAVYYYNLTLPEYGARLCLFDPLGFPRGVSVAIGNHSVLRSGIAARADGGVVVAWSIGSGTEGRIFDPNGAPVGEAFPILDGASAHAIAVSPTGGFAAVGGTYDASAESVDIWAQRFADDGAPLGPAFEVYAGPPGAPYGRADVMFDWGGNLYVIWSEYPAPFGQGPRVRGYDPDGTAFGPALTVSTQRAVGIDTARLPSGSFFNVWPNQHRLWANVVSLCTPGLSICGDGTLMPQCEMCDDGVANSDTTPDACRTDCRPARCGDGVLDGAETCDDGDTTSCDGCSATCQAEIGLVCGDGITASGCGETCDDANAIAGDGCSAACTLERIPGTGSPATDCYSEWSVVNPTNVPYLDKRGAINWVQTCVDDDVGCDADGGLSGSCTFQIRVCANNTDLPACHAPTRLARWTLTGPSATQAERDPILAAIRNTFATAPATLVGPSTRDVCTGFLSVPVPLRAGGSGPKAGKLKLKTIAEDYAEDRDKDQLRLVCLPSATP